MQPLPRSTDDGKEDCQRLFRDVAADIARRRDASMRGDPGPDTLEPRESVETYRWREAALTSNAELRQMWDWLYAQALDPKKWHGPLFLAQIQTQEQFKNYLIRLLLPDLVDIIHGVVEGILDENSKLAGRSKETDPGEKEGETLPPDVNALYDEWEGTDRGNDQKEIPF